MYTCPRTSPYLNVAEVVAMEGVLDRHPHLMRRARVKVLVQLQVDVLDREVPRDQPVALWAHHAPTPRCPLPDGGQ
eukprot:3073880-Pyramimonas_sp.AAC.1